LTRGGSEEKRAKSHFSYELYGQVDYSKSEEGQVRHSVTTPPRDDVDVRRSPPRGAQAEGRPKMVKAVVSGRDPGYTETAVMLSEVGIDMRSCFTPLEWQHIRQASTDDAPQQLDRFFRHWTLKEAYIKAVGIGLGFDLQRAQFRCREVADGGGRGLCATATVEIDGAERREWTFELEYLDAHHLVAVARGPFAQALDGYRQAIGVPEEEEEEEVATEAHQAEKEERPYRAWRVWTFEELMRHIAQRQHEPRG
jgi:hypothetical protein